MIGTLVDTCILSKFFMKSGAPELAKKWLFGNKQPLFISTITRYEIIFGFSGIPAKEAALTEALSELILNNAISLLPVIDEIALVAAQQRRKTFANLPCELEDLLIGATAAHHGISIT